MREFSLFDLDASGALSFGVRDGDVMVLNLRLADTSGNEIVRVVDGHVRVRDGSPITVERRTGEILISAPLTGEYVADWAIDPLWNGDPPTSVCLLGLRVEAPGWAYGAIRISA